MILWPDTFNDHFHPEALRAALRLLEDAGFDVILPPAGLCCGRPLYDYGFLDQARNHLTDIVDRLRRQIWAGVPIVGLEPSCVAVFRDELRNTLPKDADAKRLADQSYLLEEFLLGVADYEPAKQSGRVLLHGHCHQKSVLDFGATRKLLERAGFDVHMPDTGCCGMAGAFGFEAEHYDVSVACGERVLIPEVRAAESETLIVSDGYSCREQVHQMTDRRTLHAAELLAQALRRA